MNPTNPHRLLHGAGRPGCAEFLQRLRSISAFALAAGLCLLPLTGRLCGQTVVWIGGPSDPVFSAAANWTLGAVPPNDGTYTVEFTDSNVHFSANSYAYVAVDGNIDLHGLTFLGTSGVTDYDIYGYGGYSITLGSGGIAAQPSVIPNVYLSVPIVLSASQTWNSGSGSFYAYGNISEAGGPQSLTTMGNIGLIGDNTFSGGLTVASGTLYVGSNGAAGTGILALSDGTRLQLWGPPASLPNSISLGNNVSLESAWENNVVSTLTLSGPVTVANPLTTLNLDYETQAVLSGPITGTATPALSLTISGNDAMLPVDGGSQLVIAGSLNHVGAIGISNGALILAPAAAPSTAYASLVPGGLQVGASGTAYLGLDGAFTQEGAVSGFLATFGPSLGASINGTLGFDTFASPASPQTFNDPIDLSGFTSYNFTGLGSATSAILGAGATITPSGGTNSYLFGGGGGTLIVNGTLADIEGTQLVMNYAPEPLTLILQGTNAYTGGTSVNHGVLIFNSPPPAGAGSLSANGGYIGYAELAGISTPQQFVNLFSPYALGAVIGFDSLVSPQTIASPIDLSGFSEGYTPFLGTATAATISAEITSPNGQLQFTGVKGGQLTVSSTLTGSNDVVVGLPNPIEANGSVSSVTLSGANTYGGGTTLNSGILYVTNSSSLGTGALTAQGYNVEILAPSGGNVALGNNITVNSTLTLGQTGNANVLTLSGVISGPGGLTISGDVALDGANTYAGGTSIYNNLQTINLAIGGPSPFGSGPVSMYDISTVTVNTPNLTVTDLSGYATEMDLASNTTLTLNTDLSVSQPSRFWCDINGDGTAQLVKTGAGAQYLNGTSTYGGGTTVGAGVLIAGSNTALGTGTVTVQSGAGLGADSGVTLTNAIALNPGSALGGMGTFSPPGGVAFAGGAKVSPGSDGDTAPFIATLSFGTPVTFGSGGVYIFDLESAAGTPGSGYDTLDISGSSLSISATPALPFVINVRSVDPGSGQLGLAGFNSSQPYTWTLLSAGSVSGFDSNSFLIDTSSFQNPLNGGSFFVSENGNALDLNFTPVPEPAAWLLMGAGMATLGARILRPKRPGSPRAPAPDS